MTGLLRRHPFALTVVAGLAVRLALAFAFFGHGDLLQMEVFAHRLREDPLHVYSASGALAGSYSYPPTYLFWLAGVSWVSDHTGAAFSSLAKLAPIFADVGIAVAVRAFLRHAGATAWRGTVAGAVVLLGPGFIAISAYHGQADSVAILGGVLAVLAWQQAEARRRGAVTGALLGVGASVKTVPMLLLLPLGIDSPRWRERVALVGTAGVVFGVIVLPFLLAEPRGVLDAFTYSGHPGRGGLSLVLDPGFAVDRLRKPELALLAATPHGVAGWLSAHAGVVTALGLAALAAFLARHRPPVLEGVVLLWLVVYVVSPNFYFQYLVWILPFALMAGWIKETMLVQLAVVPPLLITYAYGTSPPPAAIAWVYVVFMVGLWVFWTVALCRLGARIARAAEDGSAGSPELDRAGSRPRIPTRR